MIKALPILVRELQVASRRPSTHGWGMLCSLAGSTLVMVALMSESLASLRGPTQSGQGQEIFDSLSLAAFAFCALAGVFACPDALSRERREGTLRLLFLTDLHPSAGTLSLPGASSAAAFYPGFKERWPRVPWVLPKRRTPTSLTKHL